MPTNTKALQVAEPTPFVAGKNKFINGDFSIWQRGTSFTNPADQAFTADRFKQNGNGTGWTKVISRQTFTPGTAPVAGYEGQYFYRFAQTVAGTGATFNNGIQQPIEDVRTFAGQTVTWSFWAKADSVRTIYPNVEKYYGVSGTGYEYINLGGVTLSTTWTRYSITFTAPSVAGKTIGANSYFMPYFGFDSNTVQTFDFWGFQIEAGGIATAFQTASGGNPQAELALCQRYFQSYGGEGTYQALPGLGTSQSATNHYFIFNFIQSMRTKPTLSLSAASDFGVTLLGVTSQPMTALAFTNTNEVSANSAILQATTGSNASLGSNHPVAFGANNTANARFNLSAEL